MGGGGGGVDWVWPAALSGKWGKQGQEVGPLDFTDKAWDLQARWPGGGWGGGLPSALPCPRARERGPQPQASSLGVSKCDRWHGNLCLPTRTMYFSPSSAFQPPHLLLGDL